MKYSIIFFVITFSFLTVLRLILIPPAIFVEGDDAALCSGIERLSTKEEIGPYFVHPFYIPVVEDAVSLQERVINSSEGNPFVYRFYRYNSMPGA